MKKQKKKDIISGIEEGSKIQKLEIAKKLKNKGMSYKEISEITGIEEKELESLK